MPAASNGSITLDSKWYGNCKKRGRCTLIFFHQFCTSREGTHQYLFGFTPRLMHSHMVTSYRFLDGAYRFTWFGAFFQPY